MMRAWLIFCIACQARAELFTSIHKLESSFTTYQEQSSAISSCITQCSDGKDEVSSDFQWSLTQGEEPFQNPVTAFKLLYHMNKVSAFLIHCECYLQRWENILPTVNDVHGAAAGLLVLQWVYMIPSDQLIIGELPFAGIRPSPASLTVEQIQFVASEAFERRYYKLEASWLIELWRIQQQEQNNKVLKNDVIFWRKLRNLCHIFREKYLIKILDMQIFGIPSSSCHSLEAIVEKADELPYQLDYLATNTDGNYDYCLQETAPPGGHCRNAIPSAYHILNPLKEEILSINPEVKMWHEIARPTEMDAMISIYGNRTQRATVPDYTVPEGALDINDRRASQFHRHENDSDVLKEEIALFTRVRSALGDLVIADKFTNRMMANYGLGGIAGLHVDSLGHQSNFATLMVYMTDVSHGGHTVFPNLGLSVRPRRGSALFWYNLRHDGSIDERMWHAGCPVMSGNKWVINKWFDYDAQFKTRPCRLIQ